MNQIIWSIMMSVFFIVGFYLIYLVVEVQTEYGKKNR